ncbi:hypothetical protein chiPu_0000525 [Chiloscyllium punctatum]|uniref:Uncharacterized protein n=1 Tax=Chiloscyllium punctatum TaxID=137246 RepID=A0A401RVF4_CHIPU|nr:hypothetical protein [Chiloscyllium punctatum]
MLSSPLPPRLPPHQPSHRSGQNEAACSRSQLFSSSTDLGGVRLAPPRHWLLARPRLPGPGPLVYPTSRPLASPTPSLREGAGASRLALPAADGRHRPSLSPSPNENRSYGVNPPPGRLIHRGWRLAEAGPGRARASSPLPGHAPLFLKVCWT